MSRTFDPGTRKLSSEEQAHVMDRFWASKAPAPCQCATEIQTLREELRMLREYVLGDRA